MDHYENFGIEDFLYDDFFIKWVLAPDAESDLFWHDWLLKNPGRQEIVDKAKIIIGSIDAIPVADELSETELQSIIRYVQHHGFGPGKTGRRIWHIRPSVWIRVAAIVVLAIGITFLYHYTEQNSVARTVGKQSAQLLKIHNNSTESKLVRLSDGSLAVLRPSSTIQYPKSFSGATRDVFLSGEAFFEVHKNPKMPFKVHSENMVTQVLGTSFTVHAFGGDKLFRVAVNTGKVMVYEEKSKTKPGNAPSVTLIPNQQVVFDRSVSHLQEDTIQHPQMLSRDNKDREFTFYNAPLRQIINKLDKAYSVNIEYDKEKLGSETLTASLSNLPLDEKVILICKAINAHCKFNDGRIIIENQ
ncbi:MAG: FecR family protein [Mucilaginibacter sp.]